MGYLPDRSEVVIRYLLERNAAELPRKEYVIFEDEEKWTYGQALHEAYRAAHALARSGIQRGENVLIFLPNGQSYLRAWWGVNFLGAIIVPVNTAYKGEMLKHVCRDSQAKHLITTSELAERVKGMGLSLNIIDPALLTEGLNEPPVLDAPLEPWDTQAIMYTSGTTGPSKGVIMSYLQIYMTGPYRQKATEKDTMLLDTALYNATGLCIAYTMCTVKGRFVLRSLFSARKYFDIVREYKVTMAVMIGAIPAFLEKRPPQPNDADNPLRVAIFAALPRDPAAFMKRFGIQESFNGFGMTEMPSPIQNAGSITHMRSCGKVMPGFETRLVDDHDIPVVPGEPGELIVRCDRPWVITTGYWQRPEETAKAWQNGWFHTGDLLRGDEDGNYFYEDRKKDAIRRRGVNISSFEVEREVLAYSDVLEVACVPEPGEAGDEEVKIFVIPREGRAFDPADLLRFLIPRMPYYMVPRYVEEVKEFPKTPTMRVKKFELRARGNSAATWDREAAGIVVSRHS